MSCGERVRPFPGHGVGAVAEEFGRGAVERDQHVRAKRIAGGLGRFGDEVQRGAGRGDVGREPALVADRGRQALGVELALQCVENLGAAAQALPKSVGAPTGMTMNSWKSIGLSAWAPPLRMFIIGTGSVLAPTPPT